MEPMLYPKMLYSADGSTMIVPNADAEAAAGPGWNDKPAEVHRAIVTPPPPVQSGQEPFIEAIAQRTAEIVMAAIKSNAPPEPPPEPPKARAKPAPVIVTEE